MSFEEAADKVRNFTTQPTNEELGDLYGLFKQATVGDCNTDKPGLLSGFTARGKWDAWDSRRGLDQEAAKEEYVAYVANISSKYE